ncbi:SatD family protein [Bacillus sp. Marseille-Q3570]|uniref:SatD family protein n=1 Tax=Bacillus sp. Marseille-Q3570 TaxID=2963522 RepID=UPI0021B797A7|nr:SatD family protein [Bacillus sp. Marseille-Q3570]
MSCVCIACDVKHSRQLDKEQLQKALLKCAEHLNEEWNQELLVPFDVRNGDELLGVLNRYSAGYLAIEEINTRLGADGIYVYIGIGLGELETTDSTIHTMNGSAVLNALDARDQFLKDNHPEAKYWQFNEENSSFFFYSEDYPYQSLNALIFAIHEKIINRSDKQKEVIKLVEKDKNATYEDIGRHLGYKSPKSTVSYLLSRSDYHTVIRMKSSLIELLDFLQEPYRKEEK